jgi:hypothetical protein
LNTEILLFLDIRFSAEEEDTTRGGERKQRGRKKSKKLEPR